MSERLTLNVLPDAFAVCRLAPITPGAPLTLPEWARLEAGPFVSVTCTADECSIVCAESAVPETIIAERGWRCLRVHGPLDFSLTGILAGLAGALAAAGISIFAISTYDTDYLLVRRERLEDAIRALQAEGHLVDSGSHPAG